MICTATLYISTIKENNQIRSQLTINKEKQHMKHGCSSLLLNPVLPDEFYVDLPAVDGHTRGLQSEEKALEALTIMSKPGIRIRKLQTPPVMDFVYARTMPTLERKGIDFVAILADGCEIPIQVKSSKRRARRFEREHKMRKANGWFTILTEALVIEPYEAVSLTIQKISEYLNRAYAAVKQQYDKVAERKKLQALRRHTNVPPRKQFRFLQRFQPQMSC